MNAKKSFVVGLHVLSWICPLIALYWFCSSLDYRIDIGWREDKAKFLEFYLFKTKITLLLIAPLSSLSYHFTDRASALAAFVMSVPGIVFLQELVGHHMIFLCMTSTGKAELGFALWSLILSIIPVFPLVYTAHEKEFRFRNFIS